MRTRAEQDSAFLNIPYDHRYESIYLAFLAGLCAFGLRPRATIEIPGAKRRLERIIDLIRRCRYSFHDLSRVQLDLNSPPTPRFNMPSELGLAVDWSLAAGSSHEWFVFESRPHRLSKSLSDLNGTDPYIHEGSVNGVLRGLMNALTRTSHRPELADLDEFTATCGEPLARYVWKEVAVCSRLEHFRIWQSWHSNRLRGKFHLSADNSPRL